MYSTDDTLRIWLPIADTDLVKSLEVDENGDYIIRGLMTSETNDEEDDEVDPAGVDCSYLLNKGWIKYEHGSNPKQFIGEPLEVKLGNFEHPKSKKMVKGIFLKARLFANRTLTKHAVETMQELQKSNTQRRMGFSIEASVLERCKDTGKVLKSIVRNVVLTMNPVNTDTWVELAKSFAANHQAIVDCQDPEDLDKAMDIAGAAEITPQSLEKDEKSQWEKEQMDKLYKLFLTNMSFNKSLQKTLLAGPQEQVEMSAFNFALGSGVSFEKADQFASNILQELGVLKSLLINAGGVKMGAKSQNTLAGLLESDIEELHKSLHLDDDELEKAINTDDEEEDKGEEDDDEAGGEEEEDEDENEEEEEDDGDDGDDVQKSLTSDFAKSFAKGDEDTSKALEVSDFLRGLVDEMGCYMDGLSKSFNKRDKKQEVLAKSVLGTMKAVQTIGNQVDEINKSLNEILGRPVGRKSVVSQREVQSIQKSLGSSTADRSLSNRQISDLLVKSFTEGKLTDPKWVAKFETAGIKALPPEVLKIIGLEG